MASPLSVGQFAGKWCSYNAPPDLPYDQREEDGGSLVFDGEVLTERIEIVGVPVVDLEFAVNRPVAMVGVRLCDVAPDGRATRISYGLLNLTHRAGHDRPDVLRRAAVDDVARKCISIPAVFPFLVIRNGFGVCIRSGNEKDSLSHENVSFSHMPTTISIASRH